MDVILKKEKKMATIQKIPDADYHAMHDHVSASMMKAMAKSPAHCQAMLHHDDEQKKESESFIFGRALHLLVLEGPDSMLKQFDIKHFSWATKEGKLEQKRFDDAGQMPLTVSQMTIINAMRIAIFKHPVARDLLNGASHFEDAILWQDEATGMPCRCKPDAMGASFIADLKSCTDASPSAFARDAIKYGYHIQAAHYLNGFKALRPEVEDPKFYFLAVEKEPPFAVGVYEFDAESMTFAHEKTAELLDFYAQCKNIDVWPGYSAKVQMMSIPKWGRG